MESQIDKQLKDRVKGVKCPKFNESHAVIPISYGKPGAQLLKAAQEGKTKLGGCCLQPKHYHCKQCQHDF